jgi:hypothetical protein
MRNGRASFVAWVISLAAYIACRFAKIEAPEVTYGLIGFTGLLVGNLGIAQGRRTARTEEQTVRTRDRVSQLEDDVEAGRNRADQSERRESGWSRHRDHRWDDDDGE